MLQMKTANTLEFRDLTISLLKGCPSINLVANGGEIHTFFCMNELILTELCERILQSNSRDDDALLYNGKKVYNGKSSDSICIQAVLKREHIFKERTAPDNVFFFRQTNFFDRLRIKQDFRALLSGLNTDEWDLNCPVADLPLEQRRIVELLRCYVMQPQILVLYETLGFFSRDGMQIWHTVINALKKQGTIIIYLTNKIEEAIYLSDTFTVLTSKGFKGNYTSYQMETDLQGIYQMMLEDAGFMSDYGMNRSTVEKNLLDIIDESSKIIFSGHNLSNTLYLFAQKIQDAMRSGNCILLVIDEDRWQIINRVDSQENSAVDWMLDEEQILTYIEKNRNTGTVHYCSYKNENFASCFSVQGSAKMFSMFYGETSIPMKVIIINIYDYNKLYNNDEVYFLSAATKELSIIIENSRLANKSALLYESHHRIKNNLQMVVSMLLMQRRSICREYQERGEIPMDAYLLSSDDLFNRIKSISLIHDIISKQERTEGVINVAEVISCICNFYQDVSIIHTDIEDIGVPYNISSSFALVVNELINNSIKHARSMDNIVITIRIWSEGTQIMLEVADNGKGFDGTTESKGIGLKLIKGIVNDELHGKLEAFNDHGAHVRAIMAKECFF